MAVRELKGLQDIISRTVVHYHMGDKGWRFVQSEDELEGSQPDQLYNLKFLRELYFKAQPDYEGRFTVPVLWDKKTESIVNNESRSPPTTLSSHARGFPICRPWCWVVEE